MMLRCLSRMRIQNLDSFSCRAIVALTFWWLLEYSNRLTLCQLPACSTLWCILLQLPDHPSQLLSSMRSYTVDWWLYVQVQPEKKVVQFSHKFHVAPLSHFCYATRVTCRAVALNIWRSKRRQPMFIVKRNVNKSSLREKSSLGVVGAAKHEQKATASGATEFHSVFLEMLNTPDGFQYSLYPWLCGSFLFCELSRLPRSCGNIKYRKIISKSFVRRKTRNCE